MESIPDILIALHITKKYSGYRYIEAALSIVLENDYYLTNLRKYVYPMISVQFGVAQNTIESAIRSAVASSWRSGSADIINQMSGIEFSAPPGNKEFLSIVTVFLQRNGKLL